MTGHRRRRASSAAEGAKLAMAGVAVGLGAMLSAGVAGAQPGVAPLPPSEPGASAPPPGQPYAVEVDPAAAPPAPPPAGPPPVPEMANPQYGQGSSPGPLGFLRDAWHQAQDPYGFASMPPDQMPVGAAPPPGAGPAPQLPPGYTSLTAPESSGPPVAPKTEQGPPLPPGYYPLDGPPPPGYFDAPPPAPPPAPGPPPVIYAGPNP